MSEQPALFGDLLPTAPGCVNGYIGERMEGGRTIHILQCQDCTDVEETGHLILMKFKFIRCAKDPEPLRRCPECTTKHLDACDYSGHNRDRNRR